MQIEIIWWLSALLALFLVIAIYFENLPTAIFSSALLILIGVSLLSDGTTIQAGKTITANTSIANITSTTETNTRTTIKDSYTNGVGLLMIVFSFYTTGAMLFKKPPEEGDI